MRRRNGKEAHHGGTSLQPLPKACSYADDVLQKLRSVQSEVKELAWRLQAALENTSVSSGSTGTGTSSDSSGLGSLDQLAADQAAARAAAGN